jgi:hypothetical protein
MRRKLIGTLLTLLTCTTPAWAQQAAKAEPEGGNLASWLLLLSPMFLGFFMIFILAIRNRKIYKVTMNRSLDLSEERIKLSRQQVALQAETNRLLERLIAETEQGQHD